MHCLVPGVHSPVQAPFEQTWPVHVTPAPHCPVSVQVCTSLPEHRASPGTHTPMQAPATQAWSPQSTGALHCPPPSQV